MQWMALGNMWFALIIPAIIVLYLLKRKVEDRVIPSTLLWQRTLQNWEAVRPWEKLRRNLLLFLQLLAAVLLVLALLRPAVTTDGVTTDHTVLVIENAGSMQTREGEQTRLEKAMTAASGLVEELGNGQTITLIEAGREPKVLLSKSSDQQQLLEAIKHLSPSYGSADTGAALSLAGAIAANETGSGVIWMGDGAADRTVELNAAAYPDHFRFMQMGMTRENTAIGAFVTQTGTNGVNGLVRIDNHGSRVAKGNVTIYDQDEKLLDTDSFSVEPGASRTITWDQLTAAPVYQAVIESQQDGLSSDNEAWSVPFTTGVGKAALISPTGNRFLHQALQTVGSMEVENLQQLPEKKGEARDVWVFDGVVPDRLPDGNVLLIAPERDVDWLPYEGKRELDEQPKTLTTDDSLLRYVDWRDVHVAKSAVLGDMPGMKTLVQAGSTDLVQAGTINGKRVVIVGFDLHDSDLPLRPAFPIFMQNVITWLAPTQAAPIGPAYPGEVLSVPLSPGANKRVLTNPDGQQQSIQATGTSWMLEVPDRTGLYRVDETLDSGQKSRYFAVQMKETESDITPKTIRLGTNGGAQQGEGNQQTANAAGSRELMKWLAALALLALFVEWRVYQRGY
ncbi:BatA and WFA domain-containing protein [Brevibacillus choshinensis]|uniref:BatA and WFA domain-containing protein n=1 Tax=Brevibacillus choshinensis TaxID=54911 RepID=UPI002E2114F9|nr:BatA and WFA domain-containing protein [Brevibacillus choshinensis]